MVRILLLIVQTVLFSITLSGQCPDRDSLFKRLLYLKDASLPLEDQLRELKKYEVEIKDCPYRNDSTHAYLLQKLGILSYKLNEFSSAVRYTFQSISIIENHAKKPLASRDQRTYYYDYFNLQYYYAALNKTGEKNAAIDSSLSIGMRFGLLDDRILTPLRERVLFLFYIGDYQRCIRYADLGEILNTRYNHGHDSLAYAMFLLNWEANVLIFYKKYEEAARLLFSKAGLCEKAGAKKEAGDIYSQIADTYLGKGDYRMAVLYYQKALPYHAAAADFLNCKITLNNLGGVYFKNFHQNDLSIQFYKKALHYTSRISTEKILDSLQTVDAFNGIAMVCLQKKEYDSCFSYLRQAFDGIRPGMHDSDLLHLSVPEFTEYRNVDLVISLLINKGDAYREKFLSGKSRAALEESLRIYRLTDLFLGKLRSEYSEIESMLFWRKESRRLYEHAIEACWFAHQPEEAFYFFEKSRSVLLNDQLNELSSLDNEKLEQLWQVKNKIVQLEKEGNQAAIVNAIFDSKQELDRLELLVKKTLRLPSANFQDSGLSYARKGLLEDHQALLELFNGDSAVYSLLVSPGQIRLDKIGKTIFDTTTKHYLFYLSNPAILNADFPGYTQTAYHLFQLIFPNGPPPRGRIIISPDGHYFPFDALVINNNPSTPLYFLDNYATSYTYSAGYLLNQGAVHPPAAGNFLGVAPLHYQIPFRMAALNGSDASLDRIGGYFSKTRNLVATQASKDQFFRLFAGYKIIQLYTHASDSGSNGEPVIYFTDSALYLSELIPKARPATQLVVLSACETGNGKWHQGEGVFNFNRGFAALGIPSCITNLWMVEDKATYRLTELFYRQLAKGTPPDIALQRAKIEYKQTASGENQLPYYWAATILAGKTDPIEYTRSFPWAWVIGGMGAIAVITLLFRGLQRRRSWLKQSSRGAILFLLSASSFYTAGAQISDSLARKVDMLFSRWDKTNSPGCSLAILKDGKIMYERGYGMSNLEYNIAITPSSIFHVASISKQFTAAAIQRLVIEGKLSLQDDIRKYVAEVPDLGYRITIDNLLHHTSGLRDQWDLQTLAGWRDDDLITENDILEMLKRQKSLNFVPGEKYLYCNTGFTLLGIVVKRVTDVPLRHYADSVFFKPLGMTNTHFHNDHTEITPNRTSAYRMDGEGHWKISIPVFDNYGATSLFTTVEDLAKWDENFYSKKIGGEKFIEGMETPGVFANGKQQVYASGLTIGHYKGQKTVEHNGSDAGYRADFLRFPDLHFSVILLANLANINPSRLCREIAGLFLPGQGGADPRSLVEGHADSAIVKERKGDYMDFSSKAMLKIDYENGRLTSDETSLQSQNDSVFSDPGGATYTFTGTGKKWNLILTSAGIQDRTYEKVKSVVVAAPALAAYTGTFYSGELDVRYVFSIKHNGLMVKTPRNEPTEMTPYIKDFFTGPFVVQFLRDQKGTVNGLKVSTGRAWDIYFARVK